MFQVPLFRVIISQTIILKAPSEAVPFSTEIWRSVGQSWCSVIYLRRLLYCHGNDSQRGWGWPVFTAVIIQYLYAFKTGIIGTYMGVFRNLWHHVPFTNHDYIISIFANCPYKVKYDSQSSLKYCT